MEFTDTLETLIKEHVDEICSEKTMVELPNDLITTDNLGEVIEKFVILHIRTWMLEDKVGVAKSADTPVNGTPISPSTCGLPTLEVKE